MCLQIPFAGSSASTSDTAALDDQQPRHALSGVHCGLLAQGESVFPSRGDSMAQGESAFPSRSDSTVDSESSSSDDELLENPPTQQPQPQPRWQQPWQWGHSGAQGDNWRQAPRQEVSERGRMWVNGGVGPLVGTSGATSSATPRGGADRQHSPRSLLRSRHQDVQSEIRTLREMLGPPEQLVDDEDDDSNPYAVRASPPPMGHYESGVEPQQRPQTARSQGRNGQSGAARFRSSAPAPEPEPEPEGDSQGSELTRMSDEMLARLHRELSRKLDGVADEISRRQQAAIEHQARMFTLIGCFALLALPSAYSERLLTAVLCDAGAAAAAGGTARA